MDEKSDTDRINDLLEKRNLDLGEIKKNLNSDKSSEFLNFFFDEDIKEVYSNFKYVKKILVLQACYHIHVFRSLWYLKNKVFSYKNEQVLETEKSDEEKKNVKLLPPITTNRSKFSFKDNNSKCYQTFSKGFQGTNYNNFKQSSQKTNALFKIGIIGCGHIGTFLLKNVIKLKDSEYINVKILISTRRPEIITSELFNVLDDNIEVFLDNERIFNECDLIFLCVQPHQLDLIIKEITTSFQERIEKLKKRKGKIFPVIFSFLAAFTLEKLASLFPEEVSVFRTYLIPSLIKNKATLISHNKTLENPYIPSKNKGDNNLNEGVGDFDKSLIGFSFEHFPKNIDFFQKFFINFYKAFYSKIKKDSLITGTSLSNTLKNDEGIFISYVREVCGENLLDYIDINSFQFSKSILQEEVLNVISENYINIMNNMIKCLSE